MKAAHKYSYQDFWEMRGRQSMWFTRNISYRVGALIALCASKLNITPNVMSLMSAGVTVSSVIIAFYLGIENVWSGLVALIGLQLGYAMDCADGPLARVTGRGSSFGMLLDKICDLASGMMFPCVLAFAAGHYYCPYVPGNPNYTLRVLLCALFIRVTLSVWMWMKELVVYQANRLMMDSRSHNWWWKTKKAVGIYIDEPVYRLGIAVFWIAGLFWEFLVIYSVGVLSVILVYILSSKKEMDAMDKRHASLSSE